jgi:transposase-like protein
MSVLSELRSRGVADVCIMCCDGLPGLPEAITVTWPQAVVQLCVVHLIRASLWYASRKYWAPLARDLRAVYTAADEASAAAALEAFAGQWENRYPAIVKLWRAHWEEFTPFLAFPPEVRRVIYTMNLIESMNARLRKVTRNRGQFPSEQAALKVLYLAVRNLEEFRRPNVGIRSSDGTSAGGIHDLLRRPDPNPMKPATITYTDDRALPCGFPGVADREALTGSARLEKPRLLTDACHNGASLRQEVWLCSR